MINLPNPLPNKEVIDPVTGEVTLIPMTEEEFIEAMPKIYYNINTPSSEGATA